MKHSQQKQLETFLLEKFIEEILPQVDNLHILCFTDSKGLHDTVTTTNLLHFKNEGLINFLFFSCP